MARAVLLLIGAGTALAAQPSYPIPLGGKPFTELVTSGTKPYLHPIRTASGKTVSLSGPADHVHHRGLWFSHGDVNGWDFWANEPDQKGVGKGRGTIRTRNVRIQRDTVRLQTEWLDGEKNILLREDRSMEFSGGEATRMIDFDVTLQAAVPVKFGDTKEGTFAIRLIDELTEKKGTGKLRSQEGAVGMKAIWGKPSPWVDYSGTVDGEPVGVAIYDHPGNPRYPTRWHARDYGLFAANIFGLHDFLNDKSQDGGLELKPGEKIRFRYRTVIHNGAGFDPLKFVPAN